MAAVCDTARRYRVNSAAGRFRQFATVSPVPSNRNAQAVPSVTMTRLHSFQNAAASASRVFAFSRNASGVYRAKDV